MQNYTIKPIIRFIFLHSLHSHVSIEMLSYTYVLGTMTLINTVLSIVTQSYNLHKLLNSSIRMVDNLYLNRLYELQLFSRIGFNVRRIQQLTYNQNH